MGKKILLTSIILFAFNFVYANDLATLLSKPINFNYNGTINIVTSKDQTTRFIDVNISIALINNKTIKVKFMSGDVNDYNHIYFSPLKYFIKNQMELMVVFDNNGNFEIYNIKNIVDECNKSNNINFSINDFMLLADMELKFLNYYYSFINYKGATNFLNEKVKKSNSIFYENIIDFNNKEGIFNESIDDCYLQYVVEDSLSENSANILYDLINSETNKILLKPVIENSFNFYIDKFYLKSIDGNCLLKDQNITIYASYNLKIN